MADDSRGSPADRLLCQLSRVRSTGPGQWLACCPAHEDRSPSLSVRETEQGQLLVFCFAGCPIADVLAAVGLEMADLFPASQRSARPKGRHAQRVSARDALLALAYESTIVAVIASDIYKIREIDTATWQRLVTAVARISAAREVAQ